MPLLLVTGPGQHVCAFSLNISLLECKYVSRKFTLAFTETHWFDRTESRVPGIGSNLLLLSCQRAILVLEILLTEITLYYKRFPFTSDAI
jgi:hypothetical protein